MKTPRTDQKKFSAQKKFVFCAESETFLRRIFLNYAQKK